MDTDNNTLYILGAGFSYHKIKTLASNLIGKIKELSKSKSCELERNPEEHAKKVMDFIKKEKIDQSCDLELLYSHIENIVNRNSKTYPFNSSLSELETVNREIRFCLRKIFFDTQRDGQYSEEIKWFLSLVRKGDSIIIFNYDCLLENSIYWAKFRDRIENMPLFNPLDGYRIRFASDNIGNEIIDMNGCKLFNRENKSDIEILKLHGSVNWSKDYRGICLYEMTPGNPIADHNRDQIGEAYHDSQRKETLWMVEPSYNKNVTEFQILWEEAEKRIVDAEKIIIIGYSFPDADFNFQHIFQKSLRGKGEIKCEVQIIDPNADAIKKKINRWVITENINIKPENKCFEKWIFEKIKLAIKGT